MNNLGPNASGPYKQMNPLEFFQPKKNSQVKPISSHPGITWVNLGTMGWVTHTKENLVWNIDGYCYLAAINLKGLRNQEWPKIPDIVHNVTLPLQIQEVCMIQSLQIY